MALSVCWLVDCDKLESERPCSWWRWSVWTGESALHAARATTHATKNGAVRFKLTSRKKGRCVQRRGHNGSRAHVMNAAHWGNRTSFRWWIEVLATENPTLTPGERRHIFARR